MRPKNLRDAVIEIGAMLQREMELNEILVDLEGRVERLEIREGHLANRDRCHSLPFPQKLRDIGCVPPHERTAA